MIRILHKHISSDGAQKVTDLIREKSLGIFGESGDGEVMLQCEKVVNM